MCDRHFSGDKRTVEKGKINKRRRRQRKIARAMAREIKTHDLDTDSSDGPEPPVPEYPVIGLQQERNDLEAYMEEDSDNSNKDLTEQNEEEREADITAESNADEQEDASNESEAAEEQEQRGSGDSEYAEEEEEANEYDELRQWAIESNVAHKNLDKLLAILRKRLLPDLPKSAKTFLKTDSCPYIVNDTQRGQFVYFDIENGLQRTFDV